MNILSGEIESIQVNGSLSLVKIKLGEVRLTSIVIDTPDSSSYLKIKDKVKVIFKETEVILGKGEILPISLQNKIVGIVESIESGALLSKVVLKTSVGTVTSIITTNAIRQLEITLNSKVTAMIKTNEMMLSE